MIRIIALLLPLITAASCSNKESIHLADGLHISGVTVITTEDTTYHPFTGHVVTDRDKIVYVGEKEPETEGTYRKIDGRGKYIIPGLIDSHVHLTEISGMVDHHLEAYPDLAGAFKKQMPRSYLYFGFTTLINLGGISEELLHFFSSQPLSPSVYHTGRSGAPVANGYPMNFAPEEIRFDLVPNFIFLESEAENTPDKFSPSGHTPEAVVRRIKKSGAIAVKSYYERGFRNMPRLPVPTTEIIKSLQENARANGLVLTVHGNSLEAHSFLGKAGVDIIAHGLWNWGVYSDVPGDSLPEEIKDVLDLLIHKQIGYTPTLTVIEGERVLADPDFLDEPQLSHVVPPDMKDWYATEEGQWFARELFDGYSPEEVQTVYGEIKAHGLLALKYLSDHGGLILFGTDTPSAPTYGNQPGFNGYWEIKLMHEAGVPLDKILASATINNARAFQLDSLTGSIRTGKRADLLLLSKDPLADVEAFNAIETIILGGRTIERTALSVQNQEASQR